MPALFSQLRFLSVCVLSLSLLPDFSVAAADLELASVFSDHMVLQRDLPVTVWGVADAGAQIRVDFSGQNMTTTADNDGKWSLKLVPMPANAKPQSLQVLSSTANRPLTINDVLVGDVWLASGQSNMEWEMQMKEDTKSDIPNTNHPQLRLFAVPLTTAITPQDNTNAAWAVSSPATSASFSAIGYYFGLKLHEELNVPIGVIQSAWGGTRIEPWTSLEGFDAVDSLHDQAASIRDRLPTSDTYRQANEKHLAAIEAWTVSVRDALAKQQSVPPMPAQPETLSANQASPTVLYNAMIHPLVPFAIRGAIWYQGESNHGEGLQYLDKTRALLSSWRQAFQQPGLPFYFVQIAPYQYGDEDVEILPRFWVAQRECARLPNTGMAVITDIAEIGDIHPAYKKEVARRLSLHALSDTYKQLTIDPNGPIYAGYTVQGNSILVRFEHADTGLLSRDDKPLTHFEIAGRDGQFHPATASILASNLLVTSPDVTEPRQVRFAWSKLAMPNLMDKDGLPAAAFHTHWPVDPDLGVNFARGCSYVCSDPNVWGWDGGLTDGSWGTRAPQCFATGTGTTYPKTVTIDLKEPRSINLVLLGVPEIGSTKTVAISLSVDNQSYNQVGKHVFDQLKTQRASIEFEDTQARFVRLNYEDHHAMKSGGFDVSFAFTTEVEVYKSK